MVSHNARLTAIATACLPAFFGCRTSTGPLRECAGDIDQVSTVVSAAPLRSARALHSATLLKDGRVLIAGGGTPETPLRTAEVWDFAKGCSTLLYMNEARLGHTATLLADGRVLVLGGGFGSQSAAANSAEIFDPASGSFRRAGSPAVPRADHAAVRLGDGRVLIVGGDVSGVGASPVAAAEIYNPVSGQFTKVADMTIPRRPFGVVVMENGKVLVAGGTTSGREVSNHAEVFDPANSSWASVAPMNSRRDKFTAALLPGGRVLVAGGSNDDQVLATTEIFDSQTLQFTNGPGMGTTRQKVVSVTLPNGDVLVIGGATPPLFERFSILNNRFDPVDGAPALMRLFSAGVLLNDGTVWVSGGYASGGSSQAAWLIRP